jgi:arylsulfatase A-like enzyme
MVDSKKGGPGYQNDLNKSSVTIAQALKPAGYRNYIVGKWHVTPRAPDPQNPSKHNWPLQRGFDRFYGTIKGGGSYFDPATLVRNNTNITPDNDPEYQPQQYYYTDAISDESARFIREHAKDQPDKPLFMYIAYTAPHWPLHAPDEAIAKYKGRYDAGYEPIRAARFQRLRQMGMIDNSWQLSEPPDSWDDQPDKAWEARCMEVYAAQIDVMDQGIGRIVQALRETGRLDNTLILFLADNGGCDEPIGREPNPERAALAPKAPMDRDELQLQVHPTHTRSGQVVLQGPDVMPGPADTFHAYGRGWANVSNTPLHEYKKATHEGGIATPLIAHWPAGIKQRNAIDHQPGHLIDLMPTCLALAGAPYPRQKNNKPLTPMQGVSLVPSFAGESIADERALFFEHNGNRAVRHGHWKLVAKGMKGQWELYDLSKDRTETNNLAADHPKRVKDLSALWHRWAEQSNVLPQRPWASRE